MSRDHPVADADGAEYCLRVRNGVAEYDHDDPTRVVSVFPKIALATAYSRDRRTIEQAIAIRYPDRPLVCPPDLRVVYAEFLMRAIESAPVPFVYADADQMPYNYSGPKRDAYLASLDRLAGCSTALAKYSAFVKREITPGDIKAPRVISAHNRSANLLFYPVAHAFEQSLLSIVDDDAAGLGLPFFAKGLNFDDRSVHIRAKMGPGYSCLCIDVTSFDNCIREGFFEGELDFFQELAPSLDFSIFRDAYIDRSPDDYM